MKWKKLEQIARIFRYLYHLSKLSTRNYALLTYCDWAIISWLLLFQKIVILHVPWTLQSWVCKTVQVCIYKDQFGLYE